MESLGTCPGLFLKLLILVFSIVCTAYLSELKNGKSCSGYDNTSVTCSLGISATIFPLSLLCLLSSCYSLCKQEEHSVIMYVDLTISVIFCVLELGSCFALCTELGKQCAEETPTELTATLIIKSICVILLALNAYFIFLITADLNTGDIKIKRGSVVMVIEMILAFVVYGCVVVDGYKSGQCVFGGENDLCLSSVYLSLISLMTAFAILMWNVALGSFPYFNIVANTFYTLMSVAWLVCFSFAVHLWDNDVIGERFKVSAKVTLAFEFLLSFTWGFLAVDSWFNWCRNLDENCCSCDAMDFCCCCCMFKICKRCPCSASGVTDPSSIVATTYRDYDRISTRSSLAVGITRTSSGFGTTGRGYDRIHTASLRSGAADTSRLLRTSERGYGVISRPSLIPDSTYISRLPHTTDRLYDEIRTPSLLSAEHILSLPDAVRPGDERHTRIANVADYGCLYYTLCWKYLETLNISARYLSSEHDMCYCQECHAKSGDKDYYERGNPGKTYALPIGWCRFGLRASDPGEWHVAFHGTTPDRVMSILQSGGLVAAGDRTIDGEEVFERSGHFTPSLKPYPGFDTKRIFVSPTIKYAGHDAYAKVKESYYDTEFERWYRPKVAFQLWIRPNSYSISGQTVLHVAQGQFDPKFSNNEIEWSTKDKLSTRVYGLLIKMQQ